jgi:GT2 family glycosyltransferase
VNDRTCDVVITTRNRPGALDGCLSALRGQSVDHFGIIVVDDCSDPPLDIESPNVTTLRLDQPSGPAAGRNAGVAVSRADFIVFVDDDVVVNREFVEAHLRAVTASAPGAGPVVSCGPFVEPADWDPTPWNLWEARALRKEADNIANGVYPLSWRQFHTGNNCLPRAMFVELGGFDETFLRSEDDEFALRLHERGCTFHYEPGAIAWHHAKRSLESWLAIPRLYAKYDIEIDRKHPDAGYLAAKKAELGERRLPLRAARAVFSGPRRTRWAVQGAVQGGRVLYRLGATSLAMGALSVAYDLSYVDSLREHEHAGR